MKILRTVPLVSASGRYGGPSDSSIAQARLLSLDGNDVTLAAGFFIGDKPDYPRDQVTYRLFPVKSLFPAPGFTTVGSVGGVRALLHEVRAAEIIHVTYSREFLPLATVVLALMMRKPLVLQPHGMLTARTGRLHHIVDTVTRPLFRRASAVIALTSQEADALSRWVGTGMPECFHVGNPRIDEAPTNQTGSSQENEALFLARLEPRKRLVDFAEAAVLAEASGSLTSYRIVGPDQGDLQNIEGILNSAALLAYEGAVPASEVAGRLSSTGVFVLPSFQEPWGNVLVLALSMGIPVVVTRSAALATVIELYGAGKIVDDGAPSQIAAAVSALLDEPEAYKQASRAALSLSSDLFDDSAIREELGRAYAFAINTAKKHQRP
ncbi:glycosyltransferase [Cryobacterium arcticum]|uniref:Uncharacterized protein n=1 Tax=Cryobacterium arcticum TaxID=670052 RepID=A0A1B1BFW1_9MICO|nr:glycosyltransferase [Cryobacterium arcticum]ANP71458.1 hypothetical protein PA27867_0487 [Cryobacterium arcticum]